MRRADALRRPDGRAEAAPADRGAQQPRRRDASSRTRRRRGSTSPTRRPARRGSPACRSRCTSSSGSRRSTGSAATGSSPGTPTTTATSTASEREFRGFGMVEQWDTEELARWPRGGRQPAGATSTRRRTCRRCSRDLVPHRGVRSTARSRRASSLASTATTGEYYREPDLADDARRCAAPPTPSSRQALTAGRGAGGLPRAEGLDAAPGGLRARRHGSADAPVHVSPSRTSRSSACSRAARQPPRGVPRASARDARRITTSAIRARSARRRTTLTLEVDDCRQRAAVGVDRLRAPAPDDRSLTEPIGPDQADATSVTSARSLHERGHDRRRRRRLSRARCRARRGPTSSPGLSRRAASRALRRCSAFDAARREHGSRYGGSATTCPTAEAAVDRRTLAHAVPPTIDSARARTGSDDLQPPALPFGAAGSRSRCRSRATRLALHRRLVSAVYGATSTTPSSTDGGYVAARTTAAGGCRRGGVLYSPAATHRGAELAEARAHFFLPASLPRPVRRRRPSASTTTTTTCWSRATRSQPRRRQRDVAVAVNDYRVLQPRAGRWTRTATAPRSPSTRSGWSSAGRDGQGRRRARATR